MKLEEIKDLIQGPAYDFLREDKRLGENIILLALGGSHAYGTNVETSDVDIRGIALNSKEEILLRKDFEQVVDMETDTVVYSFQKMMELLKSNNPNVLEILFQPEERYLYISPVGKQLLDMRKAFLSQRVFHTFGGYAREQLRRLDNKTMRTMPQERQEMHILNSIKNASMTFPEKFFPAPEDAIQLYVDDSPQENMATEIFMDIHLQHYPLRDWCGMWSTMHSIVRDYSKIGKRAKNAIAHQKLNKHAMHLVRLMRMGIEALKEGEFHTLRTKDHELLMAIRNGDFMQENGEMSPDFFQMVEELEEALKAAFEATTLPKQPDMESIDAFICKVNEEVVKKEK